MYYKTAVTRKDSMRLSSENVPNLSDNDEKDSVRTDSEEEAGFGGEDKSPKKKKQRDVHNESIQKDENEMDD